MSARLDNEVVARATFKETHGRELDEFERDQLVLLQHLNFRLFEAAYLQYRRGLFEQTEWERYQRILASNMNHNEYALEMWRRTEGGWTAEFAEEVERIRSAEAIR